MCRIDIGGDGVFHFEAELAGNENAGGWGPDPEPHIHYQLICECDTLSRLSSLCSCCAMRRDEAQTELLCAFVL